MEKERFKELKAEVQRYAPGRYKIDLVEDPHEAAQVLESFIMKAIIDINSIDDRKEKLLARYHTLGMHIMNVDNQLKAMEEIEAASKETREEAIKELIAENAKSMIELKNIYQETQSLSAEIDQLRKFIQSSKTLIEKVKAEAEPVLELTPDTEIPTLSEDDVLEVEEGQISKEPLSQYARDSFMQRFTALLTAQARRLNNQIPIDREKFDNEIKWLTSQIGKTLTSSEAQRLLTTSITRAESSDRANMRGFVQFLEKQGVKLTVN